jgi:hypothetical protein
MSADITLTKQARGSYGQPIQFSHHPIQQPAVSPIDSARLLTHISSYSRGSSQQAYFPFRFCSGTKGCSAAFFASIFFSVASIRTKRCESRLAALQYFSLSIINLDESSIVLQFERERDCGHFLARLFVRTNIFTFIVSAVLDPRAYFARPLIPIYTIRFDCKISFVRILSIPDGDSTLVVYDCPFAKERQF